MGKTEATPGEAGAGRDQEADQSLLREQPGWTTQSPARSTESEAEPIRGLLFPDAVPTQDRPLAGAEACTSMRTRAMQALDALGITYELLEFEAEAFTAAEAAERLKLPPQQLFKTLVVRSDEGKAMLACVPADQELNLRALARCAGVKRVEMVDVAELMRLTGYVTGAVSPVGTRRRYPTFIDQSALDYPRISVSAGVRGLQIWIVPADLVRATGARVEPLT